METRIFIALLALVLVLAGCSSPAQPHTSPATNQSPPSTTPPSSPPPANITQNHSAFALPISSRDFPIGMAPTPKSVPNTTFDDIVAAYQESARLGELSMVWPGGGWSGACERLNSSRTVEAVRNMGMKPVINLNFYTISEVPGSGLQVVLDAPAGVNASLADGEFRRLYVEEARSCARMFKPEYLSLGNEVGAWYATHPKSFGDFVSLYKEAYDAVKQESPDTKVFVVFSLNQMDDANQWSLISEFEPKLDMVGVTTYPWRKYQDPEDLPSGYYTRLQPYTSKPIAFTEIGWVSDASAGSSEAEQARFLVKFLNLTKGMDVGMVNWLFLHEPATLEGVAGAISGQETRTIALKKADGTRKEVYGVWQDLHQLPG